MSRLPVLFLATAALCLVVGVAMGIAMGIAHDFHLAPVHAHLNLLGWTSLSLMGLTYRAYPALEANRVAAVGQFALSAGAAMAFPSGSGCRSSITSRCWRSLQPWSGSSERCCSWCGW
ncbi:hypothetical protein ACFQU2_33630 [Siccirubricoccus deserti]